MEAATGILRQLTLGNVCGEHAKKGVVLDSRTMITASDSFGGRQFGYALVSTNDQELNLQIDPLVQCGVAKRDIFMDKISGAKSDRSGLGYCMEDWQPGNRLVVCQHLRLGCKP